MYKKRIILGLVFCLSILSLAVACGPSATLPATQVKEGGQTVPKPGQEEGTPILPEPGQEEALPVAPKPEQEDISDTAAQMTTEAILRSADGSSIGTQTAPKPEQEEGAPIPPKLGQEGMPDMATQVTAEVILRSVDGLSILDAKEAITAENVDKYRVEQEVIEEASIRLAALGLKVQQVGPISLTISGDKAAFESVFQTTLEARDTGIMDTKVSGAGAAYYEATEPIKVPEDLSSLIADVVLPTPPQFFP